MVWIRIPTVINDKKSTREQEPLLPRRNLHYNLKGIPRGQKNLKKSKFLSRELRMPRKSTKRPVAETVPEEEPKKPKRGKVATRKRSLSDADDVKNNNAKTRQPKVSKKAQVETVPKCSRKVYKEPGTVYCLGQNDAGQLGVGDSITERKKPAKVNIPEEIVFIAAGGMHSLAVSVSGKVFSWGCNDEGALGRDISEDDGYLPLEVKFPEDVKIHSVSAGDAHSAALTNAGDIYVWGVFRAQSGRFGMLNLQDIIKQPIKVNLEQKAAKICSGDNHLAILGENGTVYTMGVAENGQLGRVSSRMAPNHRHKDVFLNPRKINSRVKYTNIFPAQFGTFAYLSGKGLDAFGLNVYKHLGFPDSKDRFFPERITEEKWNLSIQEIVGAIHHTIVLDTDGKVYSIGRNEYGRLGLGTKDDAEVLTEVPFEDNVKVKNIWASGTVSLAVSKDGKVYSWGAATSLQTGSTDEDDDRWKPELMGGKQLEDKTVTMVAVGGQHSMVLAS
ncbi:DgyrCDS13894 [Dimorphilus gyrociliatus]|uniref:DgyrCDS13894 n=1 Tax=Dimorphilus gyrociliatus TaxID=2664684 RepID=A0A7I8WBZ4_9ANNE|nr:DgyrCDS13894 [Dimorphilus gyrociliatus]